MTQRDAFTAPCPTCRAGPSEPCTIRLPMQPGRVAHLARQDRHARQLNREARAARREAERLTDATYPDLPHRKDATMTTPNPFDLSSLWRLPFDELEALRDRMADAAPHITDLDGDEHELWAGVLVDTYQPAVALGDIMLSPHQARVVAHLLLAAAERAENPALLEHLP